MKAKGHMTPPSKSSAPDDKLFRDKEAPNIMKNLFRNISFALAITLPGFATADDTTDIHVLLDNYAKSVNLLDLDLAKQVFSQIGDISFIQPRGHQTGWEEIEQAFYLGAMGNFKSRNLQIRDISIRVLSENTAWGEFYWDFDATFRDGSPLQSSGRETQVWSRESGGWKIVHVHYSGMPVTGEREGF